MRTEEGKLRAHYVGPVVASRIAAQLPAYKLQAGVWSGHYRWCKGRIISVGTEHIYIPEGMNVSDCTEQ